MEAAVWKEAFEPETVLNYPSSKYNTESILDNTTYSIDEQKHNSWRFWFRQIDDSTGQERDLKRLLKGQTFNSFNPDDFALDYAMRVNDHVWRGGGAGHYYRNIQHLNYRTLSDNPLINDSLERIPALMRKRTLVYAHGDLNLPIGASDTSDDRSFFQVPIAARNFGWPEKSHGAAFYYGDKDGGLFGTPYNTSLPIMNKWYQEVFNAKSAVTLGN